MKTSPAIDRKTIAWIKTEVEQTLKEIHDFPDQYLENPHDITPIQSCLEPMHRIKGALQIANIRGAVLLTAEMETLIHALCNNKIKNIKDATEVLATCMLQLPGYLESLYYGQSDIPLILLPQLNDLRAAQERVLLSEGEFFSPDLSTLTPLEDDVSCIIDGEIGIVAKKLRPGYIQGLLGIIQHDHSDEFLNLLHLVVENLRIASLSNASRQLWWICTAILLSLKDKGLKPSVALKILLGRVDQQIKRLIDIGEHALEDKVTNKLKKNLLFYIAQSTSEHEVVSNIKQSFRLEYPKEDDIQKARAELYGFNVGLIDSISVQVRTELVIIKDALDIALHANGGSTVGLDAIVTNISSVADALGMLGMSKMQVLIHEYQSFLIEKINNEEVLDDEDFMGLAAAVLHIETSLETFGMVTENSQAEDSLLPPAEYEKLMKLIANEIIGEIISLKSSINDFLENRDNTEALQQCSTFLQNLIGAADILQQEQQSYLFQSVKDFIDHEINNKMSNDSVAEKLDLMADAVVGVEYFYESVLEKSLAPDIALNKAMQSLSKLGYDAPDNIWEDNREQNTNVTLPDFRCA